MTDNVVILCWKTPASSENNARKIAEFLGAEVTVVSLNSGESIRRLVPACTALVVHIDTLVRIAEVSENGVNGLSVLLDLAKHVFIHGVASASPHASIIRTLSSGGLLGVEPLTTTAAFRVAEGYRDWCGQFSGLSVGAVDPQKDACFVEGGSHDQQTVLIRAAGQPFFVRVDHGRADVFFVACSELADLDEGVPNNTGTLPWFSRLIPLAIFLRRALGNHIWHSDLPQACVIIDDPLLKPRYGFLEFSALLKTMSRTRFCTCIAFIPWNYRRSRRQIVDLFTSAAGSLSLCVHGYEHTGAEFADTGVDRLRDKAKLALDRMHAHSQLSGLPFDDVMVFPQGKYSPEAIEALNACGYLAAVNTHPHPSNVPHTLTLRDLLDVAMTAFADFPLFGRHYPKDVAEFAFDLFWGKPALVVEHHGYFHNGYGALESFVKQLNDLDERLEWNNLATICSRACLKRVTSRGDVHVRFYTNRFQLTNDGAGAQRYHLFRRRTSEGPLSDVAVNGRQWPHELKKEQLEISLRLDAGERADIRIISESPADEGVFSWKPTVMHNVRVFVRRILSEVRDDYVDTNRFLSGLLAKARSLRAFCMGRA